MVAPLGKPGRSWASTPGVRRSMRSNRPTDSAPRVALRRALGALGLRYRKHVVVPTGSRSVRVDLVFGKARVAVFIDGCFWHACPKHATWPRRHGRWWREKLAENVARDIRQCAALRAAGWRVLRIWAHEQPTVAARRILSIVRRAEAAGEPRDSPSRLPRL